MTFRKAFRYLFALILVGIAGLATWKYGFETWPPAVGIPMLLFIASIVAYGQEIYEGIRFNLPGEAGIDFGGDDECRHDE